ncbi:A/G-specific adenine glycosylase [Maribacter sp. 2307ULW6-5]|uniref:A/G-specific adenine glycosylase n=1 Tax=Maribacter sp. 2307ULW6-5 TaxID=3386275 RepID=UPI0039BC4123
MSFNKKIGAWYALNKRKLPWRETQDPYRIWLSEIILQQTRVAQGTPYYLRFVAAFPTVRHLAAATEEEVLKLWQGLGYYSRARNLHAAAKMVVDEHRGQFPKTYKSLLALKGVGDYTASAVASICFNEAQAVLDGNVYRVLARYHGVELPINSTAGTKYFRALAQEVMDRENARDYNQGLMEFGALQCTPKNPDCAKCPLQDGCVALRDGTVGVLPVKIKKNKVRKRYFNYLVPVRKDGDGHMRTVLRQRTGKGIWQGLWEFPLLESDRELQQPEVALGAKQVLAVKHTPQPHLYNEKQVVHKLSHQHLYTKFWPVPINEALPNEIKGEDLHRYPVPVLIADFIKTFKF